MFNYYRHIKTKKCTIIKNKCSIINEEENIAPLEETEKNVPSDSSPESQTTIINNKEAISSTKKRNDSLASFIDQPTKRKRII